MFKNEYYGNEGLGLAWDCIEAVLDESVYRYSHDLNLSFEFPYLDISSRFLTGFS